MFIMLLGLLGILFLVLDSVIKTAKVWGKDLSLYSTIFVWLPGILLISSDVIIWIFYLLDLHFCENLIEKITITPLSPSGEQHSYYYKEICPLQENPDGFVKTIVIPYVNIVFNTLNLIFAMVLNYYGSVLFITLILYMVFVISKGVEAVKNER